MATSRTPASLLGGPMITLPLARTTARRILIRAFFRSMSERRSSANSPNRIRLAFGLAAYVGGFPPERLMNTL